MSKTLAFLKSRLWANYFTQLYSGGTLWEGASSLGKALSVQVVDDFTLIMYIIFSYIL